MHRIPLWLLIVVALLSLSIGGGQPDVAARPVAAKAAVGCTPTATAAHSLVGAWSVVDVRNPASGPGVIAFTADGIVTVVGPTGRTGLGSWVATGPRTATGTWIIPGEIEIGEVGSVVLLASIEVDATGTDFSGNYDLTLRTASGTAVETSHGTVAGTRIRVEGPDPTASPSAGLAVTSERRMIQPDASGQIGRGV
jgi:hypothetical protein